MIAMPRLVPSCPPISFGRGIAVVARRVGPASCFSEQLFPLFIGEAAAIPVGARVLATMIEETDVVVFLLERLDLAFDELVQLDEVGGEILWNLEVHGGFLISGWVEPASIPRPTQGALLPASSRVASVGWTLWRSYRSETVVTKVVSRVYQFCRYSS